MSGVRFDIQAETLNLLIESGPLNLQGLGCGLVIIVVGFQCRCYNFIFSPLQRSR